MGIERYRSIVSEWDRFREAAERPEPTTLRVRRGRTTPERLRRRLAAKGFGLEPVGGLPDFLRVTEAPYSVAKTLEHWLGLFYVQQAVTGVAGPALDPRPGERVLDLCAAPGGKTVHLAELMEDRGTVVASDPDDNRIRALLGNVYRMGHPNVLVVSADGRSFPGGARFDRVLVDAPCPGEGTTRKGAGASRAQYRHNDHAKMQAIQKGLLRRAVELVRPGGVVVYSTCTYAPEENEGVLSGIYPEKAAIERIEIPEGVTVDPGVPEWGGERYRPDVVNAIRFWPHHNDTGGFFVARLRRL